MIAQKKVVISFNFRVIRHKKNRIDQHLFFFCCRFIEIERRGSVSEHLIDLHASFHCTIWLQSNLCVDIPSADLIICVWSAFSPSNRKRTLEPTKYIAWVNKLIFARWCGDSHVAIKKTLWTANFFVSMMRGSFSLNLFPFIHSWEWKVASQWKFHCRKSLALGTNARGVATFLFTLSAFTFNLAHVISLFTAQSKKIGMCNTFRINIDRIRKQFDDRFAKKKAEYFTFHVQTLSSRVERRRRRLLVLLFYHQLHPLLLFHHSVGGSILHSVA